MSDVAERYGTGFRGEVPAHVPARLIRRIDFDDGPGARTCPHAALVALAADEERVFFNHVGQDLHGRAGYWVPTRAADVRAILQTTDTFSARGIARFSTLMGESWDLIPAEIDPPEHGRYRQFLNPMFGPAAVRAVEGHVRDHARGLIRVMLTAGPRCEFMCAFARPFPILIIMTMLGLPLDRYDEVVAWGHDLHDGETIEQRARGAIAIGVFLREEIAKAKAAPPREDVISKIALGRIDGVPLSDDELIGMTYLIFTGGIHTVTASLGFHFDLLGREPALQDRLRREPAAIPGAIDEMLRTFGVVNSYRVVIRDVAFAGVEMKAGDWVSIALPLVNFDGVEFPQPDRLDIGRKPNRQMTFSFGNHFCLGAHLARAEMRIAYEELLSSLPPFRTMPDETRTVGGSLPGVERLVLDWC